MNLKQQPRILAAIALGVLGVLVAAGGGLLLVLPERSQASNLRGQLSSAEAQLVVAHAPRPHRAASTVHATDLFRLMEAMPTTDQVAGIILDLSALARSSGVQVTSIKPSPRVTLALGDSALPLSVAVVGTYKSVTAFLHRMRAAVVDNKGALLVDGRLLVTNTLQLTSADGKSVQATLGLDAFDYGAPASLTATAGPPPSASATSTH